MWCVYVFFYGGDLSVESSLKTLLNYEEFRSNNLKSGSSCHGFRHRLILRHLLTGGKIFNYHVPSVQALRSINTSLRPAMNAIYKKGRPRTGLVLGMASNYSGAKISPLVASIRATGSRCEIVIMQHDFSKSGKWEISEDLRALQVILDFHIILYSRSELESVAIFYGITLGHLQLLPAATLRFFLYHHYLKISYVPPEVENKFFVLHVDVKDVLFQTDLFNLDKIRDEKFEVLYAALESNSKKGWRVRQRSHSFTKEFDGCLAVYRFPTLKNYFRKSPPEISCSGTILGTYHAVTVHFKNIIDISLEIINENKKKRGKSEWARGCLDQSIHVLSLESGLLASEGVIVRRITTCDGLIGTIGFWGCQNRVDQFSRLIDCSGEPLSVIHQYHLYTEEVCLQMTKWPWSISASEIQPADRTFSPKCRYENNLIGEEWMEVSTSNVKIGNATKHIDSEDSVLLHEFYDGKEKLLSNKFRRTLNENILGNSYFYCLQNPSGRKACVEEYCIPCKY